MALLICCQGDFLLADRCPQRAEEFLEERTGIVRARSRLGMVLDTEDRQVTMPQALDGAVIEVDMSHFQVSSACDRPPIALHSEAVILRGDKYAASLDFLHRMVPAPMTIGHLGGGPAEGQSEKLMAEADTERRDALGGQLTNDPGRVGHCVRIPGSIREKDSVWFLFERYLRCGICGHHRHPAIILREQSQNVALDAVIVGDYVMTRARIAPRITFPG